MNLGRVRIVRQRANRGLWKPCKTPVYVPKATLSDLELTGVRDADRGRDRPGRILCSLSVVAERLVRQARQQAHALQRVHLAP